MEIASSDERRTVYLPIPGFPGYRIGNDGSIWSCRMSVGKRTGVLKDVWKQLKPKKLRKSNYLRVDLQKDGRGIGRLVHRLVLTVFVSDCPDGMECCHNDGNPQNNHVTNLRWDTRVNNMADKTKHGTLLFGEKIKHSKLTKEKILEARKLYVEGGWTQDDLAKRYGVAQSAISQAIRAAKSWKCCPLSCDLPSGDSRRYRRGPRVKRLDATALSNKGIIADG